MKNRSILLVLIIAIGFTLPACGPGQPSIVGEILEYGDHPIADRKITLCQVTDPDRLTTCTLLGTSTVSDEKGYFEFRDIPPGVYILFYDSGLSNFDAAVEKWTGQTLRIGDTEWLLDSFLENDKPKIVLFKESANLIFTEGMETFQFYMALYFMLEDSPFILAHDVDRMMINEGSIIVAVVGEESHAVKFPALFLKR